MEVAGAEFFLPSYTQGVWHAPRCRYYSFFVYSHYQNTNSWSFAWHCTVQQSAQIILVTLTVTKPCN